MFLTSWVCCTHIDNVYVLAYLEGSNMLLSMKQEEMAGMFCTEGMVGT